MRVIRATIGICAFLSVLYVLTLGLSLVQTRMNSIRVERELTDATPLENAPPAVAFTTVALGGFRGLLADWLWLRSTRMQDKGNYFEMVQLADWIVKLQPRFTGAAAFLAWNMSYNVSVTFSRPEDRWRWVMRGVELLRDEALQYNPGDPKLYKELAWIYQHKIGQRMDDANRYYKTEMAREMMAVFGTYPPNWYELANSPGTPGKLREELGDDSPLWAILARAGRKLDDVEEVFRTDGKLPEDLAKALRKDSLEGTLDRYFRARWIERVYKLDIDHVIDTVNRYGPLDYRLPEAHAIYWASLGLTRADGGVNLECERAVFQALNQAYKTGRLMRIGVGDTANLEMAPNPGLLDATNQAYLTALQNHADSSGAKGGYENFLVDATVMLFMFGEKEKAREFLARGRELNADRFDTASLEAFALDELAEDIGQASNPQAQAAIQAYLRQMYYLAAWGEDEPAFYYERVANRIWRKYMAQFADPNDIKVKERRQLPPYDRMKRSMLKECLLSFPEELSKALRQVVGDKAAAEALRTDVVDQSGGEEQR